MSIVVTGGAGFVGSHVTDAYLAMGHHVFVIDNFITGSRENISHHLDNDRLHVIEHDVATAWSSVSSRCEEFGKPEAVLHLASPASPVDYGSYPVETMRANSVGTENALNAACEWGARFVYASTSEAYGDPLEHPQREGYWGNVNPVGVRSCYDESKRYGEALVTTMVRTRNANARVIRIFNTYGPRMALNDGRVVPNFIKQALCNEPLTIYGDGSQTRSFCYVSDLVEGIVRCAASNEARGLVINLGNPREDRISDFAAMIARTVGTPLRTLHRPLPSDDPTRRCPDITTARRVLTWEPRVDLEDGLRLTIAYFRELLGAATSISP
jgi:nucleoside-diphosphate-sugar epimerase